MRWPWLYLRDTEAAGRLAEAERLLDETNARDREVHRVTEHLNNLRSRNRFAELITDALRGLDDHGHR